MVTVNIFCINIGRVQLRTSWSFFKTRPFPCLKSLLSFFFFVFFLFFGSEKSSFLQGKKKKLLNRKSIVVLFFLNWKQMMETESITLFFFTPKRGCFQKSLYPNRVLNLYPNHFMCFVASMMFQRCFVIHFSIIFFFFFFCKLQLTHMWFDWNLSCLFVV